MDVTCEHCSTEYEFDDALISARGTTVQCTQCGYRFRVRSFDPSEDIWRVRTRSGAVVEFTSLQKLQEALVRREIGADDELTRGRSAKSRRLGAISELEGFLAGDAVLSATSAKRATGTPMPASAGAREAPAPSAISAGEDSAAGPPSVPRRTITLRPEASMPPPSASTADVAAQLAPLASPEATRLPPVALREDAVTVPTKISVRESSHGVDLGPEEDLLLSSPLPPVTGARAQQSSIADEFEAAHEDDSESTHAPTRKRGHINGWVVAVVGTALVAASSVAWFRFRDSSFREQASAQAPASSAPEFVQNAALDAIQGTLALDDAHGALLALQRLSQDDQQSPQGKVLAARAHLRKADVRWFATELALDMSARALARAELEKALVAAASAVDALPKDGALLGATSALRADLLRLKGDREGARKALREAESAALVDLDYVRGALESSDPQPDVATTLKLLRAAAAKEPKPGRAVAMIAYVLARSGDVAAARTELERLAPRPEETERVAALRTFLTRFDGVDAGVEDAGGAATPVPEDPRRMLAEASSALQRGDAARARVLYQAALDKNPADSEALAGLGDVARGLGDLTRAKEYYQKAVSANGSFLPALIALADIQWDGGDRATAARTYQDIFERVPEGAYPARVRERRQGAAAAAASTMPTSTAPASSSAAAHDPATKQTASEAPTAQGPATSLPPASAPVPAPPPEAP